MATDKTKKQKHQTDTTTRQGAKRHTHTTRTGGVTEEKKHAG